MTSARVVLRRQRKKRLEAGHPWVYASEIDRIEGDIPPGDIAHVVNHNGVFLAQAYINPASQMYARVLSWDAGERIDHAFMRDRVQRAWAHRQRFLTAADRQACRAVYGEADFLPGLIVDRFGDILVVQLLSLGMERLRALILPALMDVFQPRGVLLRNDVPVRQLEGLPIAVETWFGEIPAAVPFGENGLSFVADVRGGQKTGYFFDQRDNRRSLQPLLAPQQTAPNASGATVLDCFCHTGSFAIHAAHYGAARVTAVDIAADALLLAKRNAALNGYSERIDFVTANAFDWLREAVRNRQKYDVVILDPPAFAKSRAALDKALGGYKEINLRALKLVHSGGYLVTASCSSPVTPAAFRAVLGEAALDAHKVLRLIRFAGAGQDHPRIEGVGEGDYLKFAIYQVFARG